jgi:hypothetical protein
LRRLPSRSSVPSTQRPGAQICSAICRPNQPKKRASERPVIGGMCERNVDQAALVVGNCMSPP